LWTCAKIIKWWETSEYPRKKDKILSVEKERFKLRLVVKYSTQVEGKILILVVYYYNLVGIIGR